MKKKAPQVRHRLFAKNVLQKTGAFHVDDAIPTSAEAIQKYFANEINPFHSCGVTTFHRGSRPKAVGDIKFVRPPEICDQMFEKKVVLVAWFVYMDRVSRLQEYSPMLWCPTKIYYRYYPITSPNLGKIHYFGCLVCYMDRGS